MTWFYWTTLRTWDTEHHTATRWRLANVWSVRVETDRQSAACCVKLLPCSLWPPRVCWGDGQLKLIATLVRACARRHARTHARQCMKFKLHHQTSAWFSAGEFYPCWGLRYSVCLRCLTLNFAHHRQSLPATPLQFYHVWKPQISQQTTFPESDLAKKHSWFLNELMQDVVS